MDNEQFMEWIKFKTSAHWSGEVCEFLAKDLFDLAIISKEDFMQGVKDSSDMLEIQEEISQLWKKIWALCGKMGGTENESS